MKLEGWTGRWRGYMPLCSGRRLPFSRLHTEQAVTTLAHIFLPPGERGTTWSKVRSCEGQGSPQYWHEKRARRNTLNRLKAGFRGAWTYSLRGVIVGGAIV